MFHSKNIRSDHGRMGKEVKFYKFILSVLGKTDKPCSLTRDGNGMFAGWKLHAITDQILLKLLHTVK